MKQIEARELARKLAAKEPVCLIDVRQPWEHEIAALPNSQLIPLPELLNRHGEIQPAIGALVVLYCHHGIRSISAAALLERLGIPETASLVGGIDAWSREVDPHVPTYD